MTEARLQEKRWKKELKRRAIHAVMRRNGRATQATRRAASEKSIHLPAYEAIARTPPRIVAAPPQVEPKGFFRRLLGM